MNRIIILIETYLKGRHEKIITRGLIGVGSIILVSGFSLNNWWVIIASLSDEIFNTQLNVSIESIDYTRLIITSTLGLFMILLGLWFYFRTRNPEKKDTLVRALHSSIESVSYSKVDKNFSEYMLEDHLLDQTEEMKTINMLNLQHALREQEKFVQKILNRIAGKSELEIGYFGLAHVPLVFLLGFQMSDKLSPSFFEWNQNNQIWEEIKRKEITYPKLLLVKNDEKQQVGVAKEIIVKIGITYPIADRDLEGLGLEGLNTYYLHLEKPHRNAVISFNQLNDYQREFRNLLDNINQRFPTLERIHLFYSGQPSLAYRLGSAISPRMDVEVIVYNYVKNESPKYNWAISLRKTEEPFEIKIMGKEANVNV